MRSNRPILHIVPGEPWGGIQALVPVLAREQARRGQKVRLICLGRATRLREVAAEYGVITTRRRLSGWQAPLRLLAELLRAPGAIIHSHCEPVWASGVIAATGSRRWVAHAHVYPDDTPTWKKRLSLWLQQRFAARHVAISHSIARALLASGVASAATLDVVYNGVRAEPAVPPRRPVGHFKVAFVGRAVAEKGLFEFVELAAMLANDPVFSFAAYGDGLDLPAARAFAAERGVADRVAFHGYVEDIAAAWATIDAAAVFSHREPFGLVFLEAVQRGAATVSFDNDSGGSEVAATLRSAHRVAPGDLAAAAAVLRRLAANPEVTAAALAEDRATIAARYDIATMGRGIAESYAALDLPRGTAPHAVVTR